MCFQLLNAADENIWRRRTERFLDETKDSSDGGEIALEGRPWERESARSREEMLQMHGNGPHTARPPGGGRGAGAVARTSARGPPARAWELPWESRVRRGHLTFRSLSSASIAGKTQSQFDYAFTCGKKERDHHAHCPLEWVCVLSDADSQEQCAAVFLIVGYSFLSENGLGR